MDNRPWKILLVEDDEDDYILTRGLLSESRAGQYDLEWVTSYESALDSLQRSSFDAILADYILGSQNGLDLVREANLRGYKTPIILLTGQGSYELDVEAMKIGASDYLDKSEVTPTLLERTIRYAIERRMANEVISQKSDYIEVQHHLMRNIEAERLHIAQDLHDGPLQVLIGISLTVNDLLSTADNVEMETKLKALQSVLHQQINDLRTFCSELRPPALAPFGLEKAIRSHAENYQKMHPELEVQLDLVHDGQVLPEHIRLALYRVYQELLNNIARHAHASLVLIRFSLSQGKAFLEIQDNGCGFELPKGWLEMARKGHLGLVGIQERVEAVGGNVEILTKAGQGTTVRVTAPYQ